MIEDLPMLIIVCAVLIFIVLTIFFKRKVFAPAIFLTVSVLGYIFFQSSQHADDIRETAVQAISQEENKRIIKIKNHVLIDAPIIEQLPELPRGCEVTSLAMLLGSAGIDVDKMKLAEEVKKDPAEQIVKNGKIYFGNPYKGFVGDMYSFNTPGLGVYHGPIMELGEKYLPGKLIDLTGGSFEELKIPLSDGRPVWVIINGDYRELEDSYFETWYTDDGPIKITMKEHSVLITGYDDEFVYFNDPLTGIKNRKAPMSDFKKSWVQMGSQAITFSAHE